jgi:hypothetical protein
VAFVGDLLPFLLADAWRGGGGVGR